MLLHLVHGLAMVAKCVFRCCVCAIIDVLLDVICECHISIFHSRTLVDQIVSAQLVVQRFWDLC